MEGCTRTRQQDDDEVRMLLRGLETNDAPLRFTLPIAVISKGRPLQCYKGLLCNLNRLAVNMSARRNHAFGIIGDERDHANVKLCPIERVRCRIVCLPPPLCRCSPAATETVGEHQ